MKEILPGILHWTEVHPKIKIPVSSYYLKEHAALVDPLMPSGGTIELDPAPRHILLTNRHHYRSSGEFAARYGCEVRCAEAGLGEFTHGEKVEPFRFGDTLAGGIEAIEIGELCPDETALYVPAHGGVVAVADGVVRHGDGPLGFVPDAYLGDDPEDVKRRLRRAYSRLLERDFDHLLPAHGEPWIGGAKDALRAFVQG